MGEGDLAKSLGVASKYYPTLNAASFVGKNVTSLPVIDPAFNLLSIFCPKFAVTPPPPHYLASPKNITPLSVLPPSPAHEVINESSLISIW